MASKKPGLVWGTTGTPSDLAVQVSTLADSLPFSAEEIVRFMLEEAVEEVRQAIETRGVNRGVPNRNGRIREREMLNSVTFEMSVTKAGRVQGRFGYLNNAPKWALWQEYGTQGGQGNGQGILAMLALTDAYRNFQIKMQNEFDNGRMLNFGQGQYRYNSSPNAYRGIV